MSRTSIAILCGLGLAIFVALRLEGPDMRGVIGGYLFGAAIGLTGYAWQLHWARRAPERVMRAALESFLMKLAGAMVGTVAVRYVPEVARDCEWRPFLIAYAAAVLIALLLGTFDFARVIKGESAS